MRTAILSHSAVLETNRAPFLRMRGSVTVIGPVRWHERAYRTVYTAHATEQYRALPVLFSGRPNLHIYRSGLARELNRAGPDVLFCHEEAWAPACLAACRWAGRNATPFVFYSNENSPAKVSGLRALLQQYTFAHSSGAVAVSTAVEHRMRENGYDRPVAVVPYSTEMAEAPRTAASAPCTVGYIGRLVPEKGVDVLVRAAAQNSGTRLIIAGNGPEEGRLKDRAASLNVAASFRGYVPHDTIGTVYRDIDILALPTLKTSDYEEQFGRVIIEAAARGIPVVGTDSGEIPHLIAQLGCGLHCGHNDADGLARIVKELCDDRVLYERCARSGFENSKKLYSHEAAAQAYSSFFEEIVKGRGTA